MERWGGGGEGGEKRDDGGDSWWRWRCWIWIYTFIELLMYVILQGTKGVEHTFEETLIKWRVDG